MGGMLDSVPDGVGNTLRDLGVYLCCEGKLINWYSGTIVLTVLK